MAYDFGTIDATLAAAVGDEPALIAELRSAFVDSAHRALSAMEAASSPGAWQQSGWRLKGLAASFGALDLMALAGEAADAQVGDAAVLHRLHEAVGRL
ncbi:Hpt domain-containing protein [Sphingomonas sp. IW22]|uniref:Hpt domain-containing protein n=1 Tax=Sphingomonas sp. IW22 TaxID=3242489 RepID=UPI003520CCA1